MTAPTKPWRALTAGQVVADKPFNETIGLGFRDSLEHVRSFLYDPDTHVPAKLHDHDGVNSALIQMPSPNLIERASINSTSMVGTNWVKSAGTTY